MNESMNPIDHGILIMTSEIKKSVLMPVMTCQSINQSINQINKKHIYITLYVRNESEAHNGTLLG